MGEHGARKGKAVWRDHREKLFGRQRAFGLVSPRPPLAPRSFTDGASGSSFAATIALCPAVMWRRARGQNSVACC